MVLNSVALIVAVTSRSQAYLQALIKADIYPEYCILYADSEEQILEQTGERNQYFDLSEPLIKSLSTSGIPFSIVMNKDINSSDMQEQIKKLKQDYVIYSGYGGYILKPDLFKLGKRFIHIHAGLLPAYRGSTTVYYSMLQEDYIGATVLFLNEKIDEGDIIYRERFATPVQSVNIDYVYEPWARSQALVHALQGYVRNRSFKTIQQEEQCAEIYYIIHPLLKHLALLKVSDSDRKSL